MTEQNTSRLSILSGNTLKIFACICMLIDHIGYILLPNIITLRIIGRLAFPIFAYMIAEGCKYTRNKLKYFILICTSGVVFQIVYFFFVGDWYINIFITLSLSILAIYSLQFLKYNIGTKKVGNILSSALLFILVIASIYVLNIYLTIDYGFWGCMLPVFASILHSVKVCDTKIFSLVSFSIGLVLLSAFSNLDIQIFSLLSLVPLSLYSGKRGRYNMKYFFYIFYPIHLVILYLIDILI